MSDDEWANAILDGGGVLCTFELEPAVAAWWPGAPFTPAPAVSAPAAVPEAPEHHVHGIVFDFADINRRLPREHRKWKAESLV